MCKSTRFDLSTIFDAIPMSTGTILQFATRANAHALDFPSQRLFTIAVVTSCVLCETPSATIPLSAQKTAKTRRFICGKSVFWQLARRQIASSKTPSEPRGFAIVCHLSRAFFSKSESATFIFAIFSKSSFFIFQ